MDTNLNSHALICLITTEGNSYTKRVFEWAQELLRARTDFVEINSSTFLARSKAAFEMLFKIAMDQKPSPETPPLRAVVFPCTQQVFGVMTEELKTKLDDLGLEALGADRPTGKKQGPE